MHVDGNTRERETAQVEGDLLGSIGEANLELVEAMAMFPLPKGPKETAALTSVLRWRWQDQIARALKDYVKQLLVIAERHEIQRVREWIEARVRGTLEGIRQENLPDWVHASTPSGHEENQEPGILKSRRRPPGKLRGELRFSYKGTQLRLPVVLSVHLRFLQTTILREIDAGVRRKQHTAADRSGRDTPHWIFRKCDDGWSVGYADHLSEFSDLLGMTYLQMLLRNPDRDISVEELMAAARTTPGRALISERLALDNPAGLEVAQEVLDPRAKCELRRSLDVLKEDALIAEETGNRDRLAKIREEVAFIEAELKHASGLKGRPRTFTGSPDRQRVSVRKAASNALNLISQRLPEIGEHLKASIKFGYRCSYRPRQKRDWQF